MFPVIDSVLDVQVITGRVLERYRLQPPIQCHYLHRGVNDTYVVRTQADEYYLRVYRHRWRTRCQIEAEVSMLDHLRKRHQPVSYPVPRADGRFISGIDAPEGRRWAVLFTAAVGTRPEVTNRWSRGYGTLVARLHECLDEFPRDHRRFHLDAEHLLLEPLRQLRPFLVGRGQDLSYLEGVCHDLAAEMGSLPTCRPYYGWCHGDLQGNFHEDAEGRTVLFDFDCAGYGWRAYDLAVFQHWWAVAAFLWGWGRSGRAKRAQRWRALCEGYAHLRELSAQEASAIPAFVAARHIWLIGLHCRTARTHGTTSMDLNDAYFDRHLGFIRSWMKSRYRQPVRRAGSQASHPTS